MPRLNTLMQNSEPVKKDDNERIQSIKTNSEFSIDQLKVAWQEFAEQRKKYKAEYQVLTQEIEIRDTLVTVHLHNPVQETILNDLKTEINSFLREKLDNYSIQITGELKTNDDKKVVYTNREKFEHLAEKNPTLNELKERLGLDPDF